MLDFPVQFLDALFGISSDFDPLVQLLTQVRQFSLGQFGVDRRELDLIE